MANIPAAPTQGNNKAIATVLAGAGATILVYIIDQFTPHPLPPEIVAALQTLLSGAACYFTPHGG